MTQICLKIVQGLNDCSAFEASSTASKLESFTYNHRAVKKIRYDKCEAVNRNGECSSYYSV